jgi:hypothetical protein
MCLQWQDDLSEVTAQVLKDKASLKGIILGSAKSTFFAGADLKAVMRLTPADAPKAYAEVERVKKNFRTLETLGIPVASCLNGTALGGGWEVALVGHYRVAVDDAENPVRPARGHAGPAAGRQRRDQDDAPPGPDGRAALPGRRQDLQPAPGAGAGPGA